MRRWLLLASLAVATAAGAEIYKFVDENGRVTYTNIPRKGAVKLDIGPPETPRPKAAAGAGPANFPRIDAATQKKRDALRRQILEEELAAERNALAEAQQALKEGEAKRLPDETGNPQKYLERVRKLRETVLLHERNIAALKRELASR